MRIALPTTPKPLPIWALALLLGLAAFFLIIGPKALDPRNIAWLQVGDPAQHYLGWAFYRQSPWGWPLGLNPGFGLEIGTSIVYSDSIPLLAMFFKVWSSLLPEPFQYFGIWMLACFILQAYFGLRLLSLVTPVRLLQVLGAAFFTISPIMLWRMGLHAALAGHFLILAALYLTLRPLPKAQRTSPTTPWMLLISCAALVHAYLLVMVLILWLVDVASCYQRVLQEQHQAGQVTVREVCKQALPSLLQISLVALALWAVMWLVGYFVGITSQTANYGIGRINFLALFDSHAWSYIGLLDLPDVIDHSERLAREYESFMYLGSGMLFCVCCALWAQLPISPLPKQIAWHSLRARYGLLIIAAILMTVFAVSNQVGIGGYTFTFDLPVSITDIAGLFRSSARLFWPVYYLIVLMVLYVIIKSYSTKGALIILAIGLLMQGVDTRAGWKILRHKMMQTPSSTMGTPLRDPFWEQAAKRYERVLVALPQGTVDWKNIADYAAKYHLSTNAAYLARYDGYKFGQAKLALLKTIQTGQYDPKALYLIENERVILALRHYNPKTDLFARINDLNVLAPNWRVCEGCEAIDNIWTLVPNLRIDEKIYFARSSTFNYPFVLGSGWAYPEPWGTWSTEKEASINLPLPIKTHPKSLTLTLRAFVTSKHPTQEFDLWVNGVKLQEVSLTKESNNQLTIPISPAMIETGSLNIEFKFKNPARPKDYGVGDDSRLLAIGLESAVFR